MLPSGLVEKHVESSRVRLMAPISVICDVGPAADPGGIVKFMYRVMLLIMYS